MDQARSQTTARRNATARRKKPIHAKAARIVSVSGPFRTKIVARETMRLSMSSPNEAATNGAGMLARTPLRKGPKNSLCAAFATMRPLGQARGSHKSIRWGSGRAGQGISVAGPKLSRAHVHELHAVEAL